MQSKTFRLFVSSTFSDFNQERRLLQTYVFPYIKQYCMDLNKGYIRDVKSIDDSVFEDINLVLQNEMAA